MFSIIVAFDKNGGIGQDGVLPWKISKDMNFFREQTSKTKNTNKKNCVIMGKNTYLSIPEQFRPLSKRINIILSTTLSEEREEEKDEDIEIFRNIDDVLDYVTKNKKLIEKCYVIGGESIYQQFLDRNLISCIYTTEINREYPCDKFFGGKKTSDITRFSPYFKNFDLFSTQQTLAKDSLIKERFDISFNKYYYNNLEEKNYLSLMREILSKGIKRSDRTGVGTVSLFARSLKYDLRDGTLPLLTTKFIPFRIIVEELLWMLKGSTDVSKLQEKNIHIWDGNSSRDFLDKRGLNHLPEGDIGVGYGHNLRFFGAEYNDCKTDYTGKGFDQLKYVIDLLKNDPTSRRILFCYWNPGAMYNVSLNSCHLLYQFYVDVERNELSACLYQRSSDYFLANNFNAVALCLWVRMFCNLLGFKPGEVTHFFADTHIYLNHIEQCNLQLERQPTVFPKLEILRKVEDIEDFKYEDFKLINYFPQARIFAKMAV